MHRAFVHGSKGNKPVQLVGWMFFRLFRTQEMIEIKMPIDNSDEIVRSLYRLCFHII